ncbi:MAG: VOC family protein [Actinobacteria bacterium]|nr:VOC family protein [Actinomycetota bacterium]
MPIRTAGFDHVHFHVHDVHAALEFYRVAFGAEEAFRVGERLVFIRMSGGEMVGLDGRSEAERTTEHFGLRLAEGQDLESAVAEVVRAGGALLERSEHAPGVPYAYVGDPDGNVIEL